MTNEYGAVRETCWNYFKEGCDQVELSSLNKEELRDLKRLFNQFYDFIHIDAGIFAAPSKLISGELEKRGWEITLREGSKVKFMYYKHRMSQINFTSKFGRRTKSTRNLLPTLDLRKTRTATPANYVQTIDGSIARFIISHLPRPTIHDCFLVTPFEATFLVALMNGAMQDIPNYLNLNAGGEEEIFSPFIVL